MYDTCTGLLIIDTTVTSTLSTNQAPSAEEREKALWAALDNDASFWFTEP